MASCSAWQCRYRHQENQDHPSLRFHASRGVAVASTLCWTCNEAAPTEWSTTRLVTAIAHRINIHLRKKGYLEEADGLPVLGNTEEIFAAEQDELPLPAQAASVGHRIAFGINSGKPVRRLRLGLLRTNET